MKRWHLCLTVLLVGAFLLAACGAITPATTVPDGDATDREAMGVLQFRANGEDFVRKGFVTADGWSLTFDHVYVSMADMTAYQSDPPFDADRDAQPQATVQVTLEGTYTVDLAEGDEQAEPIFIGEIMAPAGHYNALSWKMVNMPTNGAGAAALVLQGVAEKDAVSLDFIIRIADDRTYVCGDFVGDERKGILLAGETADLEATFHFDHLFGDGEADPDDEINQGAVGFEPFARLARNGMVDVDMAALEAGLAPEDYAKLVGMHLAHVGEGHCRVEALKR